MLEYLQLMTADGGTEAVTATVSGKKYRGILVLGGSATFALTGAAGWASIAEQTFAENTFIPGRYTGVTWGSAEGAVVALLAP